MSSRTVPRFALAGLLVAALAAPAAAQDARPQAPMPREGGRGHAIPVRSAEDLWRLAQEAGWWDRVPTYRPPAPTPNVLVIGTGGLQRVVPLSEPPTPLTPSTPVPTGSFAIGAGRCGPGFVKPAQPNCLVGACGTGAAPPSFVVAPTRSFAVTNVAFEVCPPCSLPTAANPLNGTWYRDAGVAQIAVTFAGNEMTVRATQRDNGLVVVTTLTAHCTVTKDGLVYGAVTSGDVDLNGDDKSAPSKMDLAELSLALQELTDMPFSFRARATTAGLMVSHLKVPIEGGGGKRDVMALGGLYKPARDGKVPEPKPVKTTDARGRCDIGGTCDAGVPSAVTLPCPPSNAAIGAAAGTTAGAPIGNACDKAIARPIGRVGVDFNCTPVMGQPVAPGTFVITPPGVVLPAPPTACPMPQPVRPVSGATPPDAMVQMAQDAFRQMILDKDRPVAGGITLPSPRHLEYYPQYFAPDPAFPLPRELAAQEDPEGAARRGARSPAVKPGVVGTWVRDVGSKRCVVKIAADHLTATVSESHDVDGKTVTGHLTFTVDYHPARDGVTAVGLVTGVDVKFDGDLPDGEAEEMMQKTGELQKILEDKPLALTLRSYGDALVIGNVRMQSTGSLLESEPAAYIGGRYRPVGDKPLPPLKVVKLAEPKPLPVYGPPNATPPGGYGTPLPSGAYPPIYAAPAPVPAGDLLPPQHIGRPLTPTPAQPATLPPIPAAEAYSNVPAVQVIQAVTVPELLPTMTAPSEPVPTMPEPVAPAAFHEKGHTGAPDDLKRWLYSLENDPDLKQIYSEWRRFWFNDQPSHLTPERIHGGIY